MRNARGALTSPLLWPLTVATDARGSLAALELDTLPFTVRRIFMVSDVPADKSRGAHAHRACGQVLVALRGSLAVSYATAEEHGSYLLYRASEGLYVPPMTWAEQTYSEDALLLVLADQPYDPDDYIRDREEFRRLCAIS